MSSLSCYCGVLSPCCYQTIREMEMETTRESWQLMNVLLVCWGQLPLHTLSRFVVGLSPIHTHSHQSSALVSHNQPGHSRPYWSLEARTPVRSTFTLSTSHLVVKCDYTTEVRRTRCINWLSSSPVKHVPRSVTFHHPMTYLPMATLALLPPGTPMNTLQILSVEQG